MTRAQSALRHPWISPAAQLEEYAAAHYGFDFNHPVILKYLFLAPDPLHAYLNITALLMKRGVHELLEYTKDTSDEVKAIKDTAREVVERPVQADRHQV